MTMELWFGQMGVSVFNLHVNCLTVKLRPERAVTSAIGILSSLSLKKEITALRILFLLVLTSDYNSGTLLRNHGSSGVSPLEPAIRRSCRYST